MIAEQDYRSKVGVNFVFPNEPGSKPSEVLVNPVIPLINYKGDIERLSGINLFGKKLIFKYIPTEDISYKIEYLQDAVYQTKKYLKNPTDIMIFLEEIGG